MAAKPETVAFGEGVEQQAGEDDLSAMAGVCNALAISLTFYAVGIAVWWAW